MWSCFSSTTRAQIILFLLLHNFMRMRMTKIPRALLAPRLRLHRAIINMARHLQIRAADVQIVLILYNRPLRLQSAHIREVHFLKNAGMARRELRRHLSDRRPGLHRGAQIRRNLAAGRIANGMVTLGRSLGSVEGSCGRILGYSSCVFHVAKLANDSRRATYFALSVTLNRIAAN